MALEVEHPDLDGHRVLVDAVSDPSKITVTCECGVDMTYENRVSGAALTEVMSRINDHFKMHGGMPSGNEEEVFAQARIDGEKFDQLIRDR